MNKEEKCSNKCPICGRPTHKKSEYCIFHASAEEKTEEEFKKALKEYIQEIKKEDKDYDFQRFIFVGKINFKEDLNVAVFKNASFRKAIFKKAHNYRLEFSKNDHGFREAIFEGHADFEWAIFEGYADFEEAIFEGHADFGWAIFEGYANFHEAIFKGDNFLKEEIKNNDKIHVNLEPLFGVKVNGDAFFYKTIFESKSSFWKAKFEGKTEFRNANFKDNISFWKATFKGTTHFGESTFNKNAGFEEAIFMGNSYFGNVTIKGIANFPVVTFKMNVVFNEATFFNDAHFGETKFEKNTSFYGVVFNKNADFGRSFFAKHKLANFSHIKMFPGYELYIEALQSTNAEFSLKGAYLENIFLKLYLSKNALIDFANAVLKDTKIEKDQIENRILQEENKDFSKAKKVFLFLKNNFHRNGQYDDENWAFKKEKDMERKSHFHFKTLHKWLWSCFLNGIFGYGLQPSKVIISAILIITLFAFLFMNPGISNVVGIEEITSNNFFDCIYFSTITFTTLGYGDFRPLEGRGRILAGSEAFIGAFMMALFVYTFARRTGGR